MIDAIDLALSSSGGELIYGPSPTAAHVENRVVLGDRDMRQSPVGQFGMPAVHGPQVESAEPSRRFFALIHQFTYDAHDFFLAGLVVRDGQATRSTFPSATRLIPFMTASDLLRIARRRNRAFSSRYFQPTGS